MRYLKSIVRGIILVCLAILLVLIFLCLWHQLGSAVTKKHISMPGSLIEIYDNEYIHAAKMGEGTYTIVMLPGMGTASPYYDYFKLATELANKNQVIIVEPLGYGFSSDTSKKRSLENYEYELSKVLKFFEINNNIILLGHSYSGISNLNYALKHEEVKGIICLDCTTAYQIETHVKNGKLVNRPAKTPKLYAAASPLGISRFVLSTFMAKQVKTELLDDISEEHEDDYKYFLYTKTMNKTIINETDDIYDNQLELLDKKYRANLYVTTFLSDETIKDMKQYKKDGDFDHDWEEMHNLLISNPSIQKIYTLEGNHYIHHKNTKVISDKVNNMINSMRTNQPIIDIKG